MSECNHDHGHKAPPQEGDEIEVLATGGRHTVVVFYYQTLSASGERIPALRGVIKDNKFVTLGSLGEFSAVEHKH